MMGRFFTWFIIGIAVTFVVIAAKEGADSAVFVFLCPLGAIIWLPVAAAFGLVGMLLGAIFGSKKPKDTTLSDHTKTELRTQLAKVQAASSKDAALRSFLQNGFDKGLSREHMVWALTRNGWSEDQLRDALRDLQ